MMEEREREGVYVAFEHEYVNEPNYCTVTNKGYGERKTEE